MKNVKHKMLNKTLIPNLKKINLENKLGSNSVKDKYNIFFTKVIFVKN